MEILNVVPIFLLLYYLINCQQLEIMPFMACIYNHRTTKTNQKYPSVNL